MTIGLGVSKQLRYKAQSALGTIAGTSGGQLLRRTSSDVSLMKDTYESNEINPSYQVQDMRHGVRRVEGTIAGELSCITYGDFFSSIFRKAWAATPAITIDTTGNTITWAAGTITRASGSWLTSGLKVGDTIRVTNSDVTANNDKNVTITAMSATVLTVVGNTLTVGSDTAATDLTFTVPGKKVWIPDTGHLAATYFTIEHWQSDLSLSEEFVDCRIGSVNMEMPATGMATCSFGVLGRNLITPLPTSAYFTSPTDITTTNLMTAVSGYLYIGGTAIAVATGISVSVDAGLSTQPVIGSNTVPDIFQGRIRVSGQATLFFENATFLEAFADETEMTMIIHMKDTSAANSEFITVTIPRIKFSGASKDDGESGLIQTLPFSALIMATSGSNTAFDKSSIVIHDSLMP